MYKIISPILNSLKKSMSVKEMKYLKFQVLYWDMVVDGPPDILVWVSELWKDKAVLLHKTDKIICKIPKVESGHDLKVLLRDPHSTPHKDLAFQNLVYLLWKEERVG